MIVRKAVLGVSVEFRNDGGVLGDHDFPPCLSANNQADPTSFQHEGGTFTNLADSAAVIEAPTMSACHLDRGLHAEERIEPAFQALVAEAERTGFTADETAFALLNLAVARILAIDASRDTDDAIARAVAAVQGL